MTFSSSGSNRFWQTAIALFFLACFLEVSRVLDVINIRGVFIGVFTLLALALIASRRLSVFFKPMAGKILPLFVGWFALAYFMSAHLGLSSFYLQTVLQGALLFAAGATLLTAVDDFKKLFLVLAAGGVILGALGVVWGGMHGGRFALRNGGYSDPNAYAMALLGIAPLIWVAFPTKPAWMKAVACLATLLPVLMAFRTASRGGFVGMLAMYVVLFFLAPFRTRFVMAGGAIAALVLVLTFMPASLRSRLVAAARMTPVEGNQAPTGDSASIDARKTLLMTSINLTLDFPVLGIGPGNFGPTVAEIGRIQGEKWLDLNTHNSYTQISCETGVPGLLLYLLILVFSVQTLIQVLRRTDNADVRRMAAALLVSLASLCTCMFFLSEGYSALSLFWFGLANGMRWLLPESAEDEEEELVEITPEQTA